MLRLKLSVLNNIAQLMDKKCRRNLEKCIAMDVYFYSSTIYYNENNHVVQIAIPWSKDTTKYGNKSILVLYLPSYLLFSRRGSCTRYCRLVLSYCRDHRTVYEPWSSKHRNNVTFLPIPVVLLIVIVRTRITGSLRARANLRKVLGTVAARVGGRGGYLSG